METILHTQTSIYHDLLLNGSQQFSFKAKTQQNNSLGRNFSFAKLHVNVLMFLSL